MIFSALGPATTMAAEPDAPQKSITVQVRPGDRPADVARIVSGLQSTGKTVVVQVVDATEAARGSGNAARAGGVRSSLVDLFDMFMAGLGHGLANVAAIPRLAPDALATMRPAGALIDPVLRTLLALAAAIALGWLVCRFVGAALSAAREDPTERLTDRLRLAGLRAVGELAGLVAFALVARTLAVRLLDDDPPALAAALAVVRGLAIFGLYAVFARFLLDPVAPGIRLMTVANPQLHRRLFLGYAAATVCFFWSAAAATAVAAAPAEAAGWIYLGGTLINAYKVWWFWTVRRDLAELVLRSAEPAGAPGPMTRIIAVLLPAAQIALPLVLWLGITVAPMTESREVVARAGAITQLLFFLVPVAAALAAGVVRERVARRQVCPHRALAARDIGAGAVGGGVVVAGLFALIVLWDFALGGQSPRMVEALRAIASAALVLVAGWAVLRYMKAVFDANAPRTRASVPGADDETDDAPQSRIATALPLIRNFATGALVAIVGLVALSRLGVDIAPLLAGAGIIGLAISFGSQALVRDIVSGIFFMADDAFRIGEYIDTGKLKGNVERITLRSLQLRHQNGQIHTIPYGQLAAITNFSRDWITMKFNIRLDRATDLEAVRRIIKAVGQEMLADPEIGQDFLLPVKMQGVTDIIENAFVVRVKFTVKPTRPTYVHRLALRRIHAALVAAGVRFATNAVTVIATPSEPHAAGAAGHVGPLRPVAG